jgi:hypothetical protein
VDLVVADVGVHPEQVGAGFQDHRHLFQGANPAGWFGGSTVRDRRGGRKVSY